MLAQSCCLLVCAHPARLGQLSNPSWAKEDTYYAVYLPWTFLYHCRRHGNPMSSKQCYMSIMVTHNAHKQRKKTGKRGQTVPLIFTVSMYLGKITYWEEVMKKSKRRRWRKPLRHFSPSMSTKLCRPVTHITLRDSTPAIVPALLLILHASWSCCWYTTPNRFSTPFQQLTPMLLLFCFHFDT